MDVLGDHFAKQMLEACRNQMPLTRKMTLDDEKEMVQCFQKFSWTIQSTLSYIQEFSQDIETSSEQL